jgi:hypothetical protein
MKGSVTYTRKFVNVLNNIENYLKEHYFSHQLSILYRNDGDFEASIEIRYAQEWPYTAEGKTLDEALRNLNTKIGETK